MTHIPFDAAHRLAPLPAETGTVEDWARYHAAMSIAAIAVFHQERRNIPRDAAPGSRPDLGWLCELGVSSLHAALMLHTTAVSPRVLWEHTPGEGALNGEGEQWLAETLDVLGINPADIDPRYTAGDFVSPSTTEAATR